MSDQSLIRPAEGGSPPPNVAQGLAPQDFLTAISGAGDVCLVINAERLVENVRANGLRADQADYEAWTGRDFLDLCSPDSREKARLALAAPANAPPRWRELNLETRQRSTPMRCLITPLQDQRALVIAQDLQPIAHLQARLIDAQHALDSDFARLRDSERRMRALLHSAPEAIVILTAQRKIVSLNAAAESLLGKNAAQAIDRSILDFFRDEDRDDLAAFLGKASIAHAAEAQTLTRAGGAAVILRANAMQATRGAELVLRLYPQAEWIGGEARAQWHLLSAINALPDAFVATDSEFKILGHNDAFALLTGIVEPVQAGGNRALEEFLGRNRAEFSVLAEHLRRNGAIKSFSIRVRAADGGVEDVDVAAARGDLADELVYGFSLRAATRRSAPAEDPAGLPQSTEQLVALVGRVALKDIVSETSTIIERLCIEAALKLTRDNRASAAELLGLSRQGLYTKLHRYGMVGADGAEEADPG